MLFYLIRLLNEEKFLKKELPGYAECSARTRFRLVPGVRLGGHHQCTNVRSVTCLSQNATWTLEYRFRALISESGIHLNKSSARTYPLT